jgi:glycosyltransferase involved in cell wall biosynthesis/uncharacterized protein YjbI with pentapeptide repeats
MRSSRALLVGFSLFAIAFLCLQLWATRAVINSSRTTSEQLKLQLANSDSNKLSQAKTEEEIIALRVENERKAVFATTFVANVNAAMAVLITLVGAAIAFYQYLGLRKKERLEEAAGELTELWKGIVSSEMNVRAASIAGLQHFLEEEKAEYHPRVAAALALVGRLENSDAVVATTFSRIVEAAMRRIPTGVLRSVSWQGLCLRKANLSGLDLAHFDFRDARLEDCDLGDSVLTDARLDAASLNWSRLSGADLTRASLPHADLVGVSLRRARLVAANLRDVKILGADVLSSDLTGASFDLAAIDWALAQNWRKAVLDRSLRDQLLSQYGPEVTGRRVLMCLWEYPPAISGGGWTATYHLLKNLRLNGVDVTVLIPWAEADVSHAELGYEYPVLYCGIEIPRDRSDASGYSSYSALYAHGSYGPAVSKNLRYHPHSLARMVADFEQRAVDLIKEKNLRFDLVHAHDWLTFRAAARVADDLAIPWIAQFHSTERDRRGIRASSWISSTERAACTSAASVVTVGTATKSVLINDYSVADSRVSVIPNCLHRGRISIDRIGSFETGRVIFLGRLSEQKGPDHFVHIAAELSKIHPGACFEMYGRGDAEQHLSALINRLGPKQGLKWNGFSYTMSAIAPVDLDPDTREWKARALHSETDVDGLRNFISGDKCVYEIEAIQLTPPYTHLLTVSKPIADTKDYYLVADRGLPPYESIPHPFVVLKGELAWENRREALEAASAVVVSSRSEPFGMVVLEAMQSGVPVFYPKTSGVAEVIRSGVQIDPEDYAGTAGTLAKLLGDWKTWDQLVEAQITEIASYSERGYEMGFVELWDRLSHGSTTFDKKQ